MKCFCKSIIVVFILALLVMAACTGENGSSNVLEDKGSIPVDVSKESDEEQYVVTVEDDSIHDESDEVQSVVNQVSDETETQVYNIAAYGIQDVSDTEFILSAEPIFTDLDIDHVIWEQDQKKVFFTKEFLARFDGETIKAEYDETMVHVEGLRIYSDPSYNRFVIMSGTKPILKGDFPVGMLSSYLPIFVMRDEVDGVSFEGDFTVYGNGNGEAVLVEALDDLGLLPEMDDLSEVTDLTTGDVGLGALEAAKLYNEAVALYGYFDLGTLWADMEAESVEVDGVAYWPVIGDYQETQTLLDDLDRVFEKTIVDTLWPSMLYTDVDGRLYCTPADRGTDIYAGKESYLLYSRADDEMVYEVTVEMMDDQNQVDGYKVFSFVIKKQLDGSWKFENFHLVR